MCTIMWSLILSVGSNWHTSMRVMAAVMVHKENPYAPCINPEMVYVSCNPKPLDVLNGFQIL